MGKPQHIRGPETPRSEPDVISEYYDQVDGLTVIAREIATGPHPRWGMKHPNTYHYITRLLLEDESERFECNHCHLADPRLDSIKAHLSAHSTKLPKPLTPEPVLRAVIREAVKARRIHGVARYAGPAAEALNKLGVQPAHGAEWTAQGVSSLYNRYKDQIVVREAKPRETPAVVPARARPAKIPTQTQADPGPVLSADDPLAVAGNLVRQAAVLLRQAELRIQEVASRPAAVDPEVLEKARKYDAMRGLLG